MIYRVRAEGPPEAVYERGCRCRVSLPEWRRPPQVTSLERLRAVLQEEIDVGFRVLHKSTDARLVCNFFGLESEAAETERLVERLDRALGEIQVPWESEKR